LDLPRTVRAEHSGEVVAVNGDVSQQCDILIFDPIHYSGSPADNQIVGHDLCWQAGLGR
jgi:hypothetical protein